ncbi:MAG: AbrB/MazE/SpoVT family DNA-binding domain-containing protein [Bryobacteraceae bacterium]
MEKASLLTVQKWGNSLAVRIPSAIAKSAGFKAGQPVQVSAQDSGVFVMRSGEPRLTLAQRLALFDPQRHGGEAMRSTPVGKEVL